MNISNNYQKNQLHFNARLPQVRQKALKKAVCSFMNDNNGKVAVERNSNKLGTALGALSSMECVLAVALDQPIVAIFAAVPAVLLGKLALKEHKEALKGVNLLAKDLKQGGFSSKEIVVGIKKHLKTEGDCVISRVYNMTHSKTLKKIAAEA